MQESKTTEAASAVPGHADHWNRRQCFRSAPLVRRRDKCPHPCPGRAPDHGRADGGEYHAPGFGRHADLRQSQRRVLAGYGRRRGVEKRDQGADNWYADRSKNNLADRQRRAACKDANDDGANDARTAVEGGEEHVDSREKWQCVYSQREKQPAKEADAEYAESETDDEHGGSFRDKRSNGYVPHHHGAWTTIDENDGERQGQSECDFGRRLVGRSSVRG